MIALRIVVAVSLFAACLAPLARAADEAPLPLAEAERLAVESAPALARQADTATAAGERAAYEDRLPDPQLSLGALNVPTDSYRLNEEDMTMLMVGVRQSFPPGRTLAYRGERARHELAREQARLATERREIVRQARVAWLDLYYLEAERRTIARMRPLMASQLDAAEGRYRAGADSLQKALQARQMATRLADREQDNRARVARGRARLAQLIGAAAYRPLPEDLPTLPAPGAFVLRQHPETQAADAGVAAAHAETAMAREEYKPGMMVELSYGNRQNRPDGQPRSDLVSAVLTVDLPLFPGRVQDRRVAEKRALEDGAQREREQTRRELEANERAAQAEAETLDERLRLYADRLLPDSERQTRVTVAGFARDQSEYREAQLRALDTELERTRLQVERAKVQAELLYLAGEPQP